MKEWGGGGSKLLFVLESSKQDAAAALGADTLSSPESRDLKASVLLTLPVLIMRAGYRPACVPHTIKQLKLL